MNDRSHRPAWRRGLLILGTLLLLPCASARADKTATTPAVLDAATLAKIRAAAQPLVDSESVVGLTIGVIDGSKQSVLGLGRLDVDAAGAPDARTVYEIGSISKVFTGTLLAHAVGAGQLKLDTPLPELLKAAKVKLKAEKGRSITLLDLATHRSGLPRMPTNFRPANPENPYADYDAAALRAYLVGAEPLREPEERYEYSNLAMGLLGHLLAQQSKTTYEALVIKHITAPLGMPNTRITLSPEMRKRLAKPHKFDAAPASNWDLSVLEGAGGLRSDMTDMLKFARSVITGGDTPVGRAHALARKAHSHAPGGPAMGLGWHLDADDRCWHNGQTGGYHAYLSVMPTKRRAVIVLSNSANGYADRLGKEIEEILDGKQPEVHELAAPLEVDGKTMDALCGTFVMGAGMRLTVTHEGRRLMAQVSGQPAWRLFAETETKWAYRVVRAHIEFRLDKEGRAKSLVLHQAGQQHEASRVRESADTPTKGDEDK